MKTDIIEIIQFMFTIIIIVSILLITGCQKNKTSNDYYQTDYGVECLYPPYTDSYKNLIFCQQKGLIDEHIQNKLTNNNI